MEVIGVTSGRSPSVNRPAGSKALVLTFDGLREAKVRDRDTRIKVTLQGPNAARLWPQHRREPVPGGPGGGLHAEMLARRGLLSRGGSLIETGGRGTRGIDRENCRQRAAELLASRVGEGEAG